MERNLNLMIAGLMGICMGVVVCSFVVVLHRIDVLFGI